MDIQMKRGMLEACVLSVLKRGDSYGYQIVKDISACMEMSESTLYPILKRLETSQMLTVYSVEHNSRLRKYYKITSLGQEKLKLFEHEWQEVLLVYNFITQKEELYESE